MKLAERVLHGKTVLRTENTRRNLAPFTRVELALKLEPLLREKAKEKEHSRKTTLQNSAKSETLDTRDTLAKIAGVSHDTVAKGKLVAEHADEETKQRLRANHF
jgi:hypothetical protein